MDIITKDTGIIDAVQQHPEILEVFAKYGLGCVGCMAAHYETIGQGAGAHGIDVEALIADINKAVAAANDLLNKKQSDVEASDCFLLPLVQ
jgi:hybrid cluster-associated redox disulfide protein